MRELTTNKDIKAAQAFTAVHQQSMLAQLRVTNL